MTGNANLQLQLVRRAALLLAITLLPGCLAPRDRGPPPHDGCIILLRGAGGDIFSRGMDSLGRRLESEGWPVKVASYLNWRACVPRPPADGAARRPCPAVIGHSFGADRAIDVARALEKQGVEVECLFLFDPRFPGPIPSNVRRCWNFMVPPPRGNGVSVRPARGNARTEIVNERKLGPNHLNIDDNESLHDFIADAVRRNAPAPPPARANVTSVPRAD